MLFRMSFCSACKVNLRQPFTLLTHTSLLHGCCAGRAAGCLREALAVANARLLPADPAACHLRHSYAAALAPTTNTTARGSLPSTSAGAPGATGTDASHPDDQQNTASISTGTSNIACDSTGISTGTSTSTGTGISIGTRGSSASTAAKGLATCHPEAAAANMLLLGQPAAAVQALAGIAGGHNASAVYAAAVVAALAAAAGHENLQVCVLVVLHEGQHQARLLEPQQRCALQRKSGLHGACIADIVPASLFLFHCIG